MSEAAQVWARGDYPSLGERLAPVAHGLVAAVDRVVGLDGRFVVDVAAGTGNAAHAAARAGARVLATDVTPELVERGRADSARLGLSVEWAVADLLTQPLDDAVADVVLSNMGMIFVPDSAAAVAEVARVLRSGGRFGFTAWLPSEPTDPLVVALWNRLPEPPEGRPDSQDWGREDIVRARLAGRFADVTIQPRTHVWVFDGEPAAVVDWLLRSSPLHLMAMGYLDDADRAAARDDFVTAFAAHHQDGQVRLDSGYLEVLATRR